MDIAQAISAGDGAACRRWLSAAFQGQLPHVFLIHLDVFQWTRIHSISNRMPSPRQSVWLLICLQTGHPLSKVWSSIFRTCHEARMLLACLMSSTMCLGESRLIAISESSEEDAHSWLFSRIFVPLFDAIWQRHILKALSQHLLNLAIQVRIFHFSILFDKQLRTCQLTERLGRCSQVSWRHHKEWHGWFVPSQGPWSCRYSAKQDHERSVWMSFSLWHQPYLVDSFPSR